MKAGAPSKYNEKMQAKAEKYLDGEWVKEGDVIPSIEGLSEYLGVVRKTLYNWRDNEKFTEFAEFMDRLLARQKRIAINQGLKGEFNPAISKLVLAQHGMHDKVDTDVTSKGAKIENNFVINPVSNADKS